MPLKIFYRSCVGDFYRKTCVLTKIFSEGANDYIFGIIMSGVDNGEPLFVSSDKKRVLYVRSNERVGAAQHGGCKHVGPAAAADGNGFDGLPAVVIPYVAAQRQKLLVSERLYGF